MRLPAVSYTHLDVYKRQVIEVLSGQKDISYGFHKITSEGSYFWAGYYVSAIVESSEDVYKRQRVY